MKEAPRENFRWAPHISGSAQVKPKDYDLGSSIESLTEYSAWAQLRDSGQPLSVGDVLETESGDLRICKYVGFEQALWFAPEQTENR